MDELENRLRGIELAEPPLGFDPDEVAGTAAKKARNRRGVVATGVATLAVIAAAVVFVAPGDGPERLAPAASSQQAPPVPKDDLQHLKDVVPKVITGAKNIEVGNFEGYGDLKTSEIRYTDEEGRPRGVNLTISGPASTKNGYPREDRCDLGKRPDGIGSDRKPTRCVELSQPDGNFVVIAETAPKSADGTEGDIIVGQGFSVRNPVTRNAIAFRPGGGSVNIFDLGTLDDAARVRPSLTDQQLLALILDPAFDPK